jgi:hypothetical protein
MHTQMHTQEKGERVADLKKLNQEISRIKNDMSKQEESLSQSLNYKLFLDSLTPQEWLEDRKKKSAAAADAEVRAPYADVRVYACMDISNVYIHTYIRLRVCMRVGV